MNWALGIWTLKTKYLIFYHWNLRRRGERKWCWTIVQRNSCWKFFPIWQRHKSTDPKNWVNLKQDKPKEIHTPKYSLITHLKAKYKENTECSQGEIECMTYKECMTYSRFLVWNYGCQRKLQNVFWSVERKELSIVNSISTETILQE